MKVSKKFREMSDERLLEVIRKGLSSNPLWAERGLLALYNLQSEAEKANPTTVHESNGRGFSPTDQVFLSDLARQCLRDVELSDRQMDWLYKLLPKYSKQLLTVIRETQGNEERASEDFVVSFFYAQVRILTDLAKIEGTTGDLELDPNAMPTRILLHNPSKTDVCGFAFNFRTDTSFVYDGEINGRRFTLVIEIADKEEDPQWALDMEKAIRMKGSQV